jgi:ABC-type lipoprotein export system ATPase subunit
MSEPSTPAPAPPPLVEARDLHKHYEIGGRRLEVLCGVELAVARGEILALRGASGAGKSTLLHLLGGIDAPNSGDIWFAGANLARMSDAARSRWRNRKVGFIFQAYHLLPELDALENVCLPARMARASAGETESRARELLARVGLAERLEHKAFELSGGEQQRVAIARAVVGDPSVILADEPTAALDSENGKAIMGILAAIARDPGRGVLVVTHDPRLVPFADRIIHIEDGLIVREESGGAQRRS